MDYTNVDEVQNYVTNEIIKANDYLAKHPMSLDSDFVNDTLVELRDILRELGIKPSLTTQAEEQYIISQYVLYGKKYVLANTFFMDFMMIETVGQWEGWEDYYNIPNKDFIRGACNAALEEAIAEILD